MYQFLLLLRLSYSGFLSPIRHLSIQIEQYELPSVLRILGVFASQCPSDGCSER